MLTHHGSLSPFICFHDCPNWGPLAISIGGNSFSGWPSRGSDVWLGWRSPLDSWQLCHFELPVLDLSFWLQRASYLDLSCLRFWLCILLWASLGIGIHSVHLSAIVDPYRQFGLAFWAPNTSWKVTESSVICIAFGVIFNKFRSDDLLTVAKAKILTVFRFRWV